MMRWLRRTAWWSAHSPGLVLAILGGFLVFLLWAAPSPVLRLDGMWLAEAGNVEHWATIAVRMDSESEEAKSSPLPKEAVDQLHAELLGTPGLQKGDLMSPLLEPQLTRILFQDATTADHRGSALRIFRPRSAETSILLVAVYRSDAARRYILEGLDRVRARFPNVRLIPVSAHLAQEELGRAALADLVSAVPIAIALLGILLSLVFRSVPIAALCLIEAGVSVGLAWLAGIVAHVPIYVTTLVAPILTLTLGLADDIYFVFMMKEALRPRRSTRRAVLRASKAAAWPLAVSSACLLVGLAIICLGETAPFRSFALFGMLSVAISFLMTFTVIPAVLSMLPPRWVPTNFAPCQLAAGNGSAGDKPSKSQIVYGRYLFLGLVTAAAMGLAHLRVSDSWLSVLPKNSEVVRASKAMAADFGGNAFILVDLLYPGTVGMTATQLDELGRLKAAALQQGSTVAALAIDDLTTALLPKDPVMKHGSEARARVIRAFGGTMASLGLYEVSAAGTRVRVLLVGRDMTSADFLDLKRRLHSWHDAHREPVSMKLRSDQFAQAEGINAAIQAQIRSMAVALIIIGLVALWFGSSATDVLRLILGCAAVVLASYGLCGWFGIGLGISTALFGTVVIAIGTGFGLYATRRGGQRGWNLAATSAILHSALVVAIGLLPMAIGSAPPVAHLSVMIAVGAFLSALYVVLFASPVRVEGVL